MQLPNNFTGWTINVELVKWTNGTGRSRRFDAVEAFDPEEPWKAEARFNETLASLGDNRSRLVTALEELLEFFDEAHAEVIRNEGPDHEPDCSYCARITQTHRLLEELK